MSLRLHRRWDLLTTVRARGLLREILPGRAKVAGLQGAVERLEDLMRRCTLRRDASERRRWRHFFLRSSSDTANFNGRGYVNAPAFFVGWLRGLGWKRRLMRSDNEQALLSFLRAAAMGLKGVEVIEQACLEGDHAANGLSEVVVRQVKAQTQVLKSHLEERLKRPLGWTLPLATWLVRHSANCLSRYRIQADGKTPDQRRTGKRRDVKLSSLEREREKQHFFRSRTARGTPGTRCGEND